jgi:DNA processing protein
LLYQIALTLVPNIGAIQAKLLIDYFGNAEEIFLAKKKELSSVDNIGAIKAENIKEFKDFDAAEEEIKFIEKFKIQPLFLTDDNYPKRLLKCYDPPTLLYYKGKANLNVTKVISIIGTRNNTEYGKQVTEKLISDLNEQEVLIISGLAYGIDAVAHKAAISNDLSTVGVLAHGLNVLYPSSHKALAKEMLLNGGLLTEFGKNTKPDKHNFPKRNRIVAGMSDAVIVVETALKGGSMITAEIARTYNREVFAFPGRTCDNKSMGCNYLIKTKKSKLLVDADQLIEELNWKKKKRKIQQELFVDLNDEEKQIVEILKEKESTHIDEIYLKTSLNSSSVAAAILNLEIQNVIASLPGKIYRMM